MWRALEDHLNFGASRFAAAWVRVRAAFGDGQLCYPRDDRHGLSARSRPRVSLSIAVYYLSKGTKVTDLGDQSPSQHVGRSPPASVGAPAPPRRPSTWSPATTSSPLTRRAASTAQSIRLLVRSDLVCVLWSVRGLGSGCSSRCSFICVAHRPAKKGRASQVAWQKNLSHCPHPKGA